MLIQIRCVLLTVIAVLASSPGWAYAQVDFSQFVTFGDSLTHNDLLGLISGNPQSLYGADPFEAVFDKGAMAGDELTSFAIGGSESVHVLLQVELFELLRGLRLRPPATLIGFEAGGNDVLNNIDLLSAHAPSEDAAADDVIDSLTANMRRALLRLSNIDPDADFLVWTVPDVTVTPDLIDELTEEEVMNVIAHVDRANAEIRQLDQFESVIVVDLSVVQQQMVERQLMICGQELIGPPEFGDFDHVFDDDIHPTAVGNAIIADLMIFLINMNWDAGIPFYSEEELCGLAHITPAVAEQR